MAEPRRFNPVKPVCGIIFRDEEFRRAGEERLLEIFGPADLESPAFDFDSTGYYEAEMGRRLKRTFLSFRDLVAPERLSDFKLLTNGLEEDLRKKAGGEARIINLDPGYLTASALVMATAKDFSHRVPLRDGIYAHLELLFTKTGVRTLEWTYPDFRDPRYHPFFLDVRRIYLARIRESRSSGNG